MSGLAGLVGLVTGSSRGIGAAVARKLASDGAAVALAARDRGLLDRVRAQIAESGGRAGCYSCDVTRADDVEATISAVERDLGSISIVVNNAGIGGPFHRTDEVSDEELDLLFATNVRSAFWICRRLLPGMASRGFGRIINISSVLGLAGAARSSTYAATKHALVGYTRSVAAEWAGRGITCNAICPGYIATEMVVAAESGDVPAAAAIPAGRFGGPAEVGEMAAFLARPDAGYINGAAMTIDGGLTGALRGTHA